MNVAEVFTAVAAAVPERECVVFRDRRLTYADVDERTNRLADVLLAQALPLPIVLACVARRSWGAALLLNALLLLIRLGVLAGMARAYPERPWTYWLSPLTDLPAAVQLWRSAGRRRHEWRGRLLVRGGDG